MNETIAKNATIEKQLAEAARTLFASTDIPIEVFTSYHIHFYGPELVPVTNFLVCVSGKDTARLPYRSFCHDQLSVTLNNALEYVKLGADQKALAFQQAEVLAESLGYTLVKKGEAA